MEDRSLPNERADRIALLMTSGWLAGIWAVGAAVQLSMGGAPTLRTAHLAVALPNTGANLGGVVVLLILLAAFRVPSASTAAWAWARIIAASGVGAAARLGLQLALGIAHREMRGAWQTQFFGALIVGVVSAGMGWLTMRSRRIVRTQTIAAEHQTLQIELALRALAYEEIRVRREVAEGLHGSVQQRLVLLVARLDRTIDRLRGGIADEVDVEALTLLRAELEKLRESDVRDMSRLLYPEQIEVSLAAALRALLRNIPASIATRLTIGDDVRALDDPSESRLTRSERLLAVRVVEEGLTNALKHGKASAVNIALELAGGSLVVAIDDNGLGFDPAGLVGSGTSRLRERIGLVGGGLALTAKPGGGARLEALIPVAALRAD